MCYHWWRTVEEPGYGWVSICEYCGRRESGEHSEKCQFEIDMHGKECVCGAAKEFEEYESSRV